MLKKIPLTIRQKESGKYTLSDKLEWIPSWKKPVRVERYSDGTSRYYTGGPCGPTDFDEFGNMR